MRSRLAARSARLVLAAAAVTALAATTTACGPEELADSGSSAAPSAAASEGSDKSSGDKPSTGGSDSSDSSDSSGSSDKGESADDGKSGYGQSCGANDLDFTVTSESQAGGYYRVTAKAKSGITCTLDVNTPSVSFGSDADGVASPVGQGVRSRSSSRAPPSRTPVSTPRPPTPTVAWSSRTSSSRPPKRTPTPPS